MNDFGSLSYVSLYLGFVSIIKIDHYFFEIPEQNIVLDSRSFDKFEKLIPIFTISKE